MSPYLSTVFVLKERLIIPHPICTEYNMDIYAVSVRQYFGHCPTKRIIVILTIVTQKRIM